MRCKVDGKFHPLWVYLLKVLHALKLIVRLGLCIANFERNKKQTHQAFFKNSIVFFPVSQLHRLSFLTVKLWFVTTETPDYPALRAIKPSKKLQALLVVACGRITKVSVRGLTYYTEDKIKVEL